MTEKRFWWQNKELSPQEKESLLKKIEQDAEFNMVTYYGCPQSTLAALQKNLGIGNVEVFKASSPFGGGISGLGDVCGAVSGALMAIGLVYGREKFDETVTSHTDPVSRECSKRGRYFCEQFRKEYGYLNCRDIRYKLRGIYPFEPQKAVRTPEEWAIRDQNHYKCAEPCAKAARLAAETILASEVTLPESS